MKHIILLLIALSFFNYQKVAGQNITSDKPNYWLTIDESNYTLHYKEIDTLEGEQIAKWLRIELNNLTDFFGKDFKQKFDIYIFSDRDSLDAQWRKDWNYPSFNSECWMVASGVAHRMDLLSPKVWKTQACEHNYEDTLATKKLILHELVHVFHGQHNQSPTFDSIENIDWFIEGLAVYASGQLDENRYERARNVTMNNVAPNQLANIWQGENKYGLAGSIVQHIDLKYGRETLIQLVQYNHVGDLLKVLNTTEEELIKSWKQSFYDIEILK